MGGGGAGQRAPGVRGHHWRSPDCISAWFQDGCWEQLSPGDETPHPHSQSLFPGTLSVFPHRPQCGGTKAQSEGPGWLDGPSPAVKTHPHSRRHFFFVRSIPSWLLCRSSHGPLGQVRSEQGEKALSDSVGKQTWEPDYEVFLRLFS